MARNKKNVLNQIVGETKKEETKIDWVNLEPEVNVSDVVIKELEKNHGVDAVEEFKKVLKEESKQTESPEYKNDDKLDGDTEEKEKPKRTLESLSRAEYRLFQRTGQMPK